MKKQVFAKTRIFRFEITLKEEIDTLRFAKKALMGRLADEIPFDDEYRIRIGHTKIDVEEPKGFYYLLAAEFDLIPAELKTPLTWREKLAAIFDVLW